MSLINSRRTSADGSASLLTYRGVLSRHSQKRAQPCPKQDRLSPVCATIPPTCRVMVLGNSRFAEWVGNSNHKSRLREQCDTSYSVLLRLPGAASVRNNSDPPKNGHSRTVNYYINTSNGNTVSDPLYFSSTVAYQNIPHVGIRVQGLLVDLHVVWQQSPLFIFESTSGSGYDVRSVLRTCHSHLHGVLSAVLPHSTCAHHYLHYIKDKAKKS